MKSISPYLNFAGNCRQAMTFYSESLQAQVELTPFSASPGCSPESGAWEGIMHSMLVKDGVTVLQASDLGPGMPHQPGNNSHIFVECESLEEIDQLFNRFSEEGKILMPLQDMFWGARFGLCQDRFGVSWMFHFPLPKTA